MITIWATNPREYNNIINKIDAISQHTETQHIVFECKHRPKPLRCQQTKTSFMIILQPIKFNELQSPDSKRQYFINKIPTRTKNTQTTTCSANLSWVTWHKTLVFQQTF